MVTRFCIAPLIDFNTNLTADTALGPGLTLERIAGAWDPPTALVEAYEARITTPSPYVMLKTKEREALAGAEWMLKYQDEVPEGEDRSSNHKESKRMVSHALLMMRIVKPTTAHDDFVLCGFVRASGPEMTHSEIGFLSQGAMTEAQRLGEFTADDGAKVAALFPKLQQAFPAAARKRNRIATALRSYRIATTARVVEPRVILYCAALEALFTTQQQEVSLQIRARLARWLGTSAADRKARWDQMNEIYGLRSAMAHGGAWEEKLSGRNDDEKNAYLSGLVESADLYVREALLKILGDQGNLTLFLGGRDNLESYWRDLLLQ